MIKFFSFILFIAVLQLNADLTISGSVISDNQKVITSRYMGFVTSVNANEGDFVNAKTEIANTGASGYAMGDHLHFGVLVQGIEVRPQEWMDKQWIKLNICDIIKSAKRIIDRD